VVLCGRNPAGNYLEAGAFSLASAMAFVVTVAPAVEVALAAAIGPIALCF
jgi:hypothetical protein